MRQQAGGSVRKSNYRSLVWTGWGFAALFLLYVVLSLLWGLGAPAGVEPMPTLK